MIDQCPELLRILATFPPETKTVIVAELGRLRAAERSETWRCAAKALGDYSYPATARLAIELTFHEFMARSRAEQAIAEGRA